MLDAAVQAAKQAGRYIKDHIGEVLDVQTKDGQERNPLSEVGRNSEKMIIDLILQRFLPDSCHPRGRKEATGAASSDYRCVQGLQGLCKPLLSPTRIDVRLAARAISYPTSRSC